MTQATLTHRLNKTADELEDLLIKSKRKMLEFEVLMSAAERKQGKFFVYKNVDELFKKLKIK